MDVRYSVYRVKDDFPIAVIETIPKCAKALGITVESFYTQASKQRKNKYSAGKKENTVLFEKMCCHEQICGSKTLIGKEIKWKRSARTGAPGASSKEEEQVPVITFLSWISAGRANPGTNARSLSHERNGMIK